MMRRATQLLIVTISLSLAACTTVGDEEILEDYAWQARSERAQAAHPYEHQWTAEHMQSVIESTETLEETCAAFRIGHACPSGTDAASRVESDSLRCTVWCQQDGVFENGMYLSYTQAEIPTIEKGPFVDGKRSGAWSTYKIPSSGAKLVATEVRHYVGGVLEGESTKYLSSGNAIDRVRYVDGVRSAGSESDLYGGL